MDKVIDIMQTFILQIIFILWNYGIDFNNKIIQILWNYEIDCKLKILFYRSYLLFLVMLLMSVNSN